MIKVLVGDMFKSNAQTLVNPINCVGVMGKGLALQFKNRFPDMFKDYVKRCHSKQVHLGQPYLFKNESSQWILNFPTKNHWRSTSKLQDIIEGLQYLQQNYKDWGITSLAVPALGCGNGGLSWRIVGAVLYQHLKTLDIPIELYAPFGTHYKYLDPSFLDLPIDELEANQRPSVYKISPPWVSISGWCNK